MPNPAFDSIVMPQICSNPMPVQLFNNYLSDCNQSKTKTQMINLHKSTLYPIMENLIDIPNLYFFDPLDALCPGVECTTKINSKQIYQDGSHLSVYGSERIYTSLTSFMRLKKML